jgi:hypothetical protein
MEPESSLPCSQKPHSIQNPMLLFKTVKITLLRLAYHWSISMKQKYPRETQNRSTSQEISSFLQNTKVCYHIHNSPPWTLPCTTSQPRANSIYNSVSKGDSFRQVLRLKRCIQSSSFLYLLHGFPISFPVIKSPYKYLGTATEDCLNKFPVCSEQIHGSPATELALRSACNGVRLKCVVLRSPGD